MTIQSLLLIYSYLALWLLAMQAIILPKISMMAPLLVTGIAVIIYYVFKRKGLLIFLALYGVLILGTWEAFKNDMSITLNAIAMMIAEQRFWLIPLLEVSDKQLFTGFFVGAVALLLLTLLIETFMKRQASSFIVMASIVFIISIVLDRAGVAIFTVLLYGMTLYLIMVVRNNKAMLRYSWLVPTLIVVIGLTSMTWVNMGESTVASSIQEKLISQWSSFRYGNKAPLPDGKLQQTQPKATTNTTMLEIATENIRPMYLKGFIGSTYQNNEWHSLSGGQYLQRQAVFEQLLQQGFNAQTQFYMLTNTTQPAKLNIANRNANRHYFYTPYEANQVLTTSAKEGTAYTSGIKGERNYQWLISETPYYQYPQVAKQVYAKQDEAYLAKESHYNAYVYKNETVVSKEDKQLLTTHFPAITTNEKRLSYEQATQLVLQQVEDTLTYDEQKFPVQDNILAGLLAQQSSGYAVHYATIATLLYRTLGIPARYVEGYVVTLEDTLSKGIATTKIPAKNAHAWTEIYIDQLGWMPVEVTPPYRKIMPEIEHDETTTVPDPKEALSKEAEGPPEELNEQFIQQNELPPQEKEPEQKKMPIKIWLSMLVLLLIILLGIWLYRRHKLRKILRLSPKFATTTLYLNTFYMYQSMHKATTLQQWSQGEKIAPYYNMYLGAQYGELPITDEDKQHMYAFYKSVRTTIWQQAKWYQKIKLAITYY
ncbi:hypothetical protein GCM10007425_03330 [Lysinibacillus alkalisoli]|uniref:Transglutaminase-like domain-containing protein n=1 Tax=Lysinibacillus alkalisoli TaxID=1911548 RepID=A0A917D684_9BACI|nr:transglutaminase domain-containing protein [Lysinibacillus alkalisoli]GGG12348.1 hypothetical protein GCM10007425_03330 [Lysinibacillus alkalisoli]